LECTLRIIGVAVMSDLEDLRFREIFKDWALAIETHQRYIFEESARFVDALKQRRLSAKAKNEIAIVIKGLQATVKSVSKVVGKYIE
jgi:hypothetical protein